MKFIQRVEKLSADGKLPHHISQVLTGFYGTYVEAVKDVTPHLYLLNHFLDFVIEQLAEPFEFEPFHKKITSPFDYYRFGIDFFRPLVKLDQSKIIGENQLNEIGEKLSKKENVILLANHQSEPDPQAIALLLEKNHPDLARNMIFVAGHKVIKDPLTVPFSKGCDLLCIYSKNYIHFPPEEKQEKQLHNQRVMHRMKDLLAEGGKCIYVAPSGGRDRPGESGKIEVSRFDGQSIEMFWLMAKKSGHPTHFYPLALSTYNLLPPPSNIQAKLGEQRKTTSTPIHLGFGPEIDMENYPGNDHLDKTERRQIRGDYIWNLVKILYEKLEKDS